MKTTMNISISGIAFNIETDAYALLTRYTSTLEKKYKNNPDGAEIIGDIEARIAELILTWQVNPGTPVTESCIQGIIDQLGLPDDLPGEGTDSDPYGEPAVPPPHPITKITKRFYRNREGRMLGGVINGMSTYFGIDVTILRIILVAFAAITIPAGYPQMIGWLSIAYALLWVIVPMAKTPRQKLEMKGEPITVSSLETSLRQSMDNIANNPRNEKSASIFTNIIYGLGKVIRAFLIVIAVIVGISLLISVFAILVGAIVMHEKGRYGLEILTSYSPLLVNIVAALSALMPLIFILYILARMIFNTRKMNTPLLTVILVLWIGSWIAGGAMLSREMMRNSVTEEVRTVVALPAVDTLYVKNLGNPPKNWSNRDNFAIGPYENWTQIVPVNSTPTEGKPQMVIYRKSKGKYYGNAIENAEKIDIPYSIVGDTVFLSPLFEITRQMKYHKQQARINLELPVNTVVVMDEHLSGYRMNTIHNSTVTSYTPRPEGTLVDTSSNGKRVEIVIGDPESGGAVTMQVDSTGVRITGDDGTVKREIINIKK